MLYVALTRAREKLILTGTVEDAAQVWEKAQTEGIGQLDYLSFITARNYMDLLLPILAKTDFTVKVVGKEELSKAEVKEQLDLELRRMQLAQIADATEIAEAQGRMENAEECEIAEAQESIENVQPLGVAADAAVRELRGRLMYEYPHRSLEKLYTKTTVSELKAEAMAERDEAAHDLFEVREREPYVPSFVGREKKVSGTLRGSAFHRAMELLDFDRILDGWFDIFPENYEAYQAGLRQAQNTPKQDHSALMQRIEEFLREQMENKRLSAEYYGAVNPMKVQDFLQSDCAYRMWRAERENRLYREQPFVLGIDAKELSGRFEGDVPEGETLLIQGIIDVFWIEGDDVILLDYKTDRIGSMGLLWERYEAQMVYYSRALQQILGRPVRERILYSSYLGESAGRP